MTPARAVFERMRVGIGWRTEIDVIATTRPHPCACMAGTAALHIAIVDSAFSSNARAYASTSSIAREVARRRPAGVGHEDVDPAERVARGVDEAGRTGHRADVGDERDRVGADPGRGRLDRRARPGRRSRPARPPRPAPARRRSRAPSTPRPPPPACLRSRGPSAESCKPGQPRRTDAQIGAFSRASCAPIQWMGPVPSRSDGTHGAAGAQGDDLGADRDRGLLRGPAADVEPDRGHDPRQAALVDARPPAAAPPASRASAASPSPPRSRRRSASAPTIAGTSNFASWVSTQTASRGPSGSADRRRRSGRASRCTTRRPSGTGPASRTPPGRRTPSRGSRGACATLASAAVKSTAPKMTMRGGGDEALDEDADGSLARLAVLAVVPGRGEPGRELGERVASDDPVEVGITERAERRRPRARRAAWRRGARPRSRWRARPDARRAARRRARRTPASTVTGGSLTVLAYQSSGSTKRWTVPPHVSPTANASSSE